MNTLALSLHRLGDLIMHAHVLSAYHKHSEHRLCLLTHPFYKQIDFLFPFIEDTFIFERDLCQKSIGEPYFNKQWSFQHIDYILRKLKRSEYIEIIDLAQTETSARWMTFLKAKHQIGVSYDSARTKKSFCSENPYIRYIHAHKRSSYHFIDLFKRSLYLPLETLPSADSPQTRDQHIVFQTLTSDIKKNWPISNWQRVLSSLALQLSDFKISIMASPSEYPTLKDAFSSMPRNVSVQCTSIKETFQLLKSAALLVTLDTAIKHLASWTQTPTLEIALGSSSPLETGIYQSGAWILMGQAHCSPCTHSHKCHQPSYLCQQSIRPEQVIATILNKLGFAKTRLEDVFEVGQNTHGWWEPKKLSATNEVIYERRN